MVILAPFSDKVPMACKKQVAPIIKLDSFFLFAFFFEFAKASVLYCLVIFYIFLFRSLFKAFLHVLMIVFGQNRRTYTLRKTIQSLKHIDLGQFYTSQPLKKRLPFLLQSFISHNKLPYFPGFLEEQQGMTFFRNNSLVKKISGLQSLEVNQ